MYPFGIARGALTEIRRWLDRALIAAKAEPTVTRIRALYGAALTAYLRGLPGDIQVGAARAAEAQDLAQHMTDPLARGLAAVALGYAALLNGEYQQACSRFELALEASDDPTVQSAAMSLMGWALEFMGDIARALIWQEKALALSEALGASVYRSWVLWSVGIGWWLHGNAERAEDLLREGLAVTQLIDDPRHGAALLEALAWVTCGKRQPQQAVVLMAAAETLGVAHEASPLILPDLAVFHDQCERQSRDVLGDRAFQIARDQGRSMDFDTAVSFALSQ